MRRFSLDSKFKNNKLYNNNTTVFTQQNSFNSHKKISSTANKSLVASRKKIPTNMKLNTE